MMPLFKVWSGEQKKLASANNFEELKMKGCEKLGIKKATACSIALEDGTEVDASVDIMELTLSVFIFSEESKGTVVISDSDQSKDSGSERSQQEKKPVEPENSDQGKTGAGAVRVTQQIPLPTFSGDLQELLKTDQFWAKIDRIIEQAAFWVLSHGDIKTKEDYDDFGARMVNMYPKLAVESKRPYGYFVKKLSRKLRNLRLNAKKRSESTINSPPPVESKKRRKMSAPAEKSADSASTGGVILSDNSKYKEDLQAMKTLWQCDKPDKAKIKVIMARTFKMRRLWINGMQSPDTSEILEKFPVLTEAQYFKGELLRILNGITWDQLRSNFAKVLRRLSTVFEDDECASDEADEDDQAMQLVMELDKATKWRSVNSDAKLVEVVSTVPKGAKRDSPRLVILDQASTSANGFILYDQVAIDCDCDTFEECVLMLVGAYYVFYLNYPNAYCGFLGFLQVHVFEDTDNKFKETNKYIEFSKKYNDKA